MKEESVQDILERIHREVAPSLGELCIQIERKKLKISQIVKWADALTNGAKELEKLAEKMANR